MLNIHYLFIEIKRFVTYIKYGSIVLHYGRVPAANAPGCTAA